MNTLSCITRFCLKQYIISTQCPCQGLNADYTVQKLPLALKVQMSLLPFHATNKKSRTNHTTRLYAKADFEQTSKDVFFKSDNEDACRLVITQFTGNCSPYIRNSKVPLTV